MFGHRFFHAVCRYARLPRSSRRFVARAWLAAPAVEAAVASIGLAATLRWIDRLPRGRRRSSGSAVGVRDGASLVKAAYRWHFVRGACLPQAVLQFALHRWDGVPADLRIGVARGAVSSGPATSRAKPLAAHAWVDAPEAPPPSDDPNAAFAPVVLRSFAG
jgi:hypothetical protein